MTLSAGTRLGPYEVQELLGSGGMGEVYRARDTRLDRPVAIKVLPAALSQDSSLRQRFEREARVISSFDHPHICGLLDIGHDAGHDYLVMQYLEGVTLAARLEGGALPLAEALNIGAQVADALAAAHARGVIHRDVKPANIMLTAAGARLLDFGLARVTIGAGMQMGETMTALTAQRTILGTLHYMAPEQVEGREADARTDIFALGAVLYEMLAGKRAFEGDSAASVMAAVIRSEQTPLTDAAPLTPPSVQTLVSRCLARNPDERWQSASDLAFALRWMTATPPVAGDPARTTRRNVIAVAAVLGAAAAGVASGALLSRSQPVAPQRGEVRLTLLPPAGQEFAGTFTDFDMDFAVSPDGTQVAFVTVDVSGVHRLWIRPLGSSAARALSGTEGATRPFWSPDSRFVAFNSDAGISRIALPDGAPQVIVPATLVDRDSRGSWGPGKILFDAVRSADDGSSRALFVVSESGGQVTPIPQGKRPESETGQRYPQALPDGRHFLYLSWAPDPETRGIYLGAFDSDQRTLLMRTEFRAEFVAPDILLYIRGRALVAQRITLQGRRVVGEAQIVVDQLALEGIFANAAFATSNGGTVAYRTRSREIDSELRWIDRKGAASEPIGPAGSDVSVSLSPDERFAAVMRLVSSSTRERLPGNLWLLDLARGVPSRFTLDETRIDENPIWSPDGRRIAYASHRASALTEVRVQDVSESGQGTLLFQRAENFHPIDWSPDGNQLLLQGYATTTGAADIDLWVVELRAGAEPHVLLKLPRIQSQGQFSPNGKWLAYTSDESGEPQVYLRALPSSRTRIQVSAHGGAQPRWRGDSGELFYVARDGSLTAVKLDRNGEPGSPVILFRERSLRINNSARFYGGAPAYSVTSDGSRFLVNRMTREPAAGPLQIVLGAAALR
jgi:eukaryotic-like serine/threonine-protein kinase